jgi:hypothetical protein
MKNYFYEINTSPICQIVCQKAGSILQKKGTGNILIFDFRLAILAPIVHTF